MSQHPAKGHGYPLGFHPTCRCLSFSSLRLPEAGRKHSPCCTEAPEPRLPGDAAGKTTHPRGQKRRDAVCPAARIRITLEGERGLQWKPRPGRLGVLGGPPSKCCGTSCRGVGSPSISSRHWVTVWVLRYREAAGPCETGALGCEGAPGRANHASRRQLRTSGFVFVPASPAINTRSQKTQARSRAKAEMADGDADPHRPQGGGGESQWGRQSSTAKDTSCLPKMTAPTPR